MNKKKIKQENKEGRKDLMNVGGKRNKFVYKERKKLQGKYID